MLEEETALKIKKTQKLDEDRLIRRQKKEELKLEEITMKETEMLIEKKLKEKEEQEIAKLETHDNMKKFYCIAFVVLFLVMLYMFIKIKIESKQEYLFN